MKTKNLGIDFNNLGFGFIETNSMLVSDYKNGKWGEVNYYL